MAPKTTTPYLWGTVLITYGWMPEDAHIDAFAGALSDAGATVIGYTYAPEEADEGDNAIRVFTALPATDEQLNLAEAVIAELAGERDWDTCPEFDIDELDEDERAEFDAEYDARLGDGDR